MTDPKTIKEVLEELRESGWSGPPDGAEDVNHALSQIKTLMEEEVIGEPSSCICENAGTEICDNHWSLRQEQRTQLNKILGGLDE